MEYQSDEWDELTEEQKAEANHEEQMLEEGRERDHWRKHDKN